MDAHKWLHVQVLGNLDAANTTYEYLQTAVLLAVHCCYFDQRSNRIDVLCLGVVDLCIALCSSDQSMIGAHHRLFNSAYRLLAGNR